MILTNGVNSITIKVREKYPQYNWGYEWMERSDNSLITIDRGSTSDVYETEIIISENYNNITTIYNFLNNSRTVPSIQISDVNVNEAPFGENLDYTSPLNVVVLNVEPIEQTQLNSFKFSFTLRLVSFPQFVGDDGLPNMKCLDNTDSRNTQWARDVLVSYENDNFAVEKTMNNDIFEIDISLKLSIEDTKSLLNFYRLQRGKPFNYRAEDWGVRGITEDFMVIITNINIEYISGNSRKANLTLRRQ
jgi:hypothetical protein